MKPFFIWRHDALIKFAKYIVPGLFTLLALAFLTQAFANHGNGQIDHVTFDIDNPDADIWEANGTLPYGISVTKGGADVTVSAVTLTSEADALSVTFEITLDVTDADLTFGTDTSVIEFIYTPTTGGAACVNCIKSDTAQLAAIVTGDTGDLDTEIDKAAPVLRQISAPTAGNKPSYGFSSTEAGTITYGGNCGNGDLTAVVRGNNTAFFGGAAGLAAGMCNSTITVTDPETNASVPLVVPQIVVQAADGNGFAAGTIGEEDTEEIPSIPMSIPAGDDYEDDEDTGELNEDEETPFVPTTPPPFGDIAGHSAQAFITELFNRGVINGKSPGIYDPDGKLTRAELTKMATLAFGVSVPATVSEAPFRDVEVTAWYAPFIQVAKNMDIVEGFPENLFKPNSEVTRAEALKIILETSGANVVAGNNPFSDVEASSWYISYVTFAAERNIVSGYGDGRFGQNDSITRAEIAKIFMQAISVQGQ